jgi:fatty acid amide hydrolase
LTIESQNNIWGKAMNPWNKNRSCGGSTGGDSGLVAANISPLGIGTDLAGSLRIPTHFCGIAGFKNTSNRFTTDGLSIWKEGDAQSFKPLQIVIGPVAKKVYDLVLCLKSFWNVKVHELDARIPPMPFNEELYNSKKPMRIGVWRKSEMYGNCVAG